jgi:hypothetical protein
MAIKLNRRLRAGKICPAKDATVKRRLSMPGALSRRFNG